MLYLHHLPCSALRQPPPAGEWLGAACFGGGAADPDATLPLARVPAPPLGRPSSCEAWAAAGPLRVGGHGPLRWRCNDEWWFAAVQLDENLNPIACPPLQHAAQQAYALLFDAMAAAGFEHLVRVWHHVGDITGEGGGLERYRQFNIGRQEAFLARGRSVEGGSVPAASALGAVAGAPLVLYALAGRRPVQAIENPRQISAYHYPPHYGPRSPTFSRATLARAGCGQFLFVSGTASIVGHRSLHPGDVVAQTRETMRNLQAVLDEAGQAGAAGWTLPRLHYKVYVRHASDWPQIEAELRSVVGDGAPVLALQADVCRSELLVEIEAVGLCGAAGTDRPSTRREDVFSGYRDRPDSGAIIPKS